MYVAMRDAQVAESSTENLLKYSYLSLAFKQHFLRNFQYFRIVIFLYLIAEFYD